MNVVPKPYESELREGRFVFTADTAISSPLPAVVRLLDAFGNGGRPAFERNRIEFSLTQVPYDYVLEVTENKIIVVAPREEGLYHGAVTLKQLLSAPSDGEVGIGACVVRDKPRFAYRGMLVDVCRHFFGVDTIKKIIDAISLFKFNYLHLHLSDDQGFMLQTDSLHELYLKGSVRAETCGDGKPHGGYYTKKQVQELVAYARERFVEIVPEIDLPGHTRAIIAAYPELSCTGESTTVGTDFGIHAKMLCAGSEKVYDAVEKLLTEVAEMFPCGYFHLGGDEVPKLVWENCPKCNEKMRKEGLRTFEELQGYFTNRAIAVLKKLGKTPILWNESLYSDMLDSCAAVQYWEAKKKAGDRVKRAVAEEGRRIIVSRCSPYYFDYPCAFWPLKSVYNFEPCTPELGGKDGSCVLGVECPIWTEHVSTEEKLFFRVFPRAAAVAESGWSTPEKDYKDFVRRLDKVLGVLCEAGVNFEPVKKCNPDPISRMFTCAAFGINAAKRANPESARNYASISSRKELSDK